MSGLLDLVVFLFTMGVLPVLINKSTERGRFDWVLPHLRPVWTAIFAGCSIYLIQKQDTLEALMRIRTSLDAASPLLGYGICAIIGASILCGYWWFAGRMFPAAAQPVEPTFDATVSGAGYPVGTVLGEIPWSPRFTDLRVSIINSGSVDWTDLDVTFRPDQPIVAIGQTTAVPDVFVSASASTDMTLRMEYVLANGQRTAVPLVLIASSGDWKMQCKKLPRRQRIEVIFASASLPEYDGGPPKTPKPDFGVFDRDYAIRSKFEDFSHWYGHGSDAKGRIEEVYSEKRPISRTIKVTGRYVVKEQEFTFSKVLTVHDLIGDAIPTIRDQIKSTK